MPDALPSVHRTLEERNQISIRMNDEDEVPERAIKKIRITRKGEAARPKHVKHGDWKDMMKMTRSTMTRPRTSSSIKSANWIENRIKKIECGKFVASHKFSTRCGCGALMEQHSEESRRPHLSALGENDDGATDGTDTIDRHTKKWTIAKNTVTKPTDSYGSILFEGKGHQTRAQFVRASFDTEPEAILHLLEKVWGMQPPKLIITIHGGLTNFDLTPKLARLFRKGIVKAARSTDAWIISTGFNAGVVRHVASALEELGASRANKAKVLAIGIAPWGMLKTRQRFEGKDVTVNYSTNQFNKSRLAEVNDRHNCFIFADNGTVGRYGAEIILRKRLESHLARRSASQHGTSPVVCVVLEGGAFTIKVVHDYVTTIPHIPVVVVEGSGRAADMLAYAHKMILDDGSMTEQAKMHLSNLIESVFSYDRKNAARLMKQILECAKLKNLMTVFRLGEAQKQDVDHAILTALLKGKNLSPTEQLRLALAWDRADIARTEIFTMGTEWTMQDLHSAMIDALCHDRTDFVSLLLENGVSMHRFLTYGRLEHLYNTEFGPHHTLRNVMGLGAKKHRIKLTEVGHAMEDLMGHAYKSNYTKEDFKAKYFVFSNRKQLGYTGKMPETRAREQSENLGNELKLDLLKTARNSIFSILGAGMKRDQHEEDENSVNDDDNLDFIFRYPYSELLIWAVLTKRQEMAMLMWRHGEEALAKSLVACRLYSSLQSDASSNFLELELCEEIEKYSDEFRELSIEVLQFCSGQDTDQTLQLLTYELNNWGNETCLSLAALDGNRRFLAHPCCQLLLSDLWHGALSIRNSSNIKILGCILLPPAIFMLDFKSVEELKLQPHTAAEHHEQIESDSEASIESDYTDSDTSDSDEEELTRKRASTDNGQVMSFHQLMKDHMPFGRGDKVAPVGNGAVGNREEGVRPRTKTLNSIKTKRKTIKGTDDETDGEPSRIRSTSRKGDHTFHHRYADVLEKSKPLSWRRRVHEFYEAPITTFWLWSLAFVVFMLALIFVLLIETPRNPSWVEWYLFSYIVVWACEVGRKVLMTIIVDTKAPIHRKLGLFFFNYRNGLLSFALIFYIIAFFIRLNPSTRALGRVLLASNSVCFVLKLVDYLSVHRQIGPYITMAAEMIPRMLPILCMLFCSLLGFGLIRQSITYPDENWHWLLLRNIFYKPYFMLYGEVYAPEIDTCGDEVWDTHIEDGIPIQQLNVTHDTCVPGYFMVPIFMTVFMIIANVLLMNTMVACCTYVFESNVAHVQEIWLFERYRQVMEYESTPFLPPPLTIIYHIYWVVKWLLVKEHFVDRKHLLDASMSESFKKILSICAELFLSEEEIERIHSYEEECVEDMERDKDLKKMSSNDQRILRTAERTDLILNRINTIVNTDSTMKREVREMEERLNNLQKKEKDQMEYLRLLDQKIELLLQLGGGAGLPLPQPKEVPPVKSLSLVVPSITVDLVDSDEHPSGSRRGSTRYQPTEETEGDEYDEEEEDVPRRRKSRNVGDLDRRFYNEGPPNDTAGEDYLQSEESDSNIRKRRKDPDSPSKRRHY